MQNDPTKKAGKSSLAKERPNVTRPVWGNQEMTCGDCNYNDQDIDTFPCAKCHTRH